MFDPNLAAYELATWAENDIKVKLSLSKTWKRKPNKNEAGVER